VGQVVMPVSLWLHAYIADPSGRVGRLFDWGTWPRPARIWLPLGSKLLHSREEAADFALGQGPAWWRAGSASPGRHTGDKRQHFREEARISRCQGVQDAPPASSATGKRRPTAVRARADDRIGPSPRVADTLPAPLCGRVTARRRATDRRQTGTTHAGRRRNRDGHRRMAAPAASWGTGRTRHGETRAGTPGPCTSECDPVGRPLVPPVPERQAHLRLHLASDREAGAPQHL
jgi:hypothetical protein